MPHESKSFMPSRGQIAFLSSAHPAFDIRVFRKEATSAAAAGFNVTYIVPHEIIETVDGVLIKALPRPRNRPERIFLTSWQVMRAALRENADIYHLHDPELIPIGLLLKLWGRRVIYDVHEDVPADVATKPWLPRPLRRPLSAVAAWFERTAGSRFDGIIATTPQIADHFPPEKTVLVQNFPLLEELTTTDRTAHASRAEIFVYVGRISWERGAREMIDAMSFLPASSAAELVLTGMYIPPLRQSDLESLDGWSRTRFVGYTERNDLAGLLSQARAGLVLFHKIPVHTGAIPNKLFEYMAAGLPIIISDIPLWRHYVEDIRCALFVDPTDPSAIAKAIQWVIGHPEAAAEMGARGRTAVRDRYNWPVEADKLSALYSKIIG